MSRETDSVIAHLELLYTHTPTGLVLTCTNALMALSYILGMLWCLLTTSATHPVLEEDKEAWGTSWEGKAVCRHSFPNAPGLLLASDKALEV